MGLGVSSRGVGAMSSELPLSRSMAYKFLARLVDKHPDDAIGILKDIIVGYWLFPNGDGAEFAQLTDLEKEVSNLMATGLKLQAIKRVREVTGLGLKDAKDYVEQRVWPNSGNKLATEMHDRTIGAILTRLSQDFNVSLKSEE